MIGETHASIETVLVIEHGYINDGPPTRVPYLANSNNLAVMWGVTSAPQENLNNSTFPVLVASVVGGGSVVNGMVYIRGSKSDYEAWEALGNKGWGWDGLFPYFIKGTTFTPPPASLAEEYNITWNETAYGKNGPLQVSFHSFQWPDLKNIWATWANSGLPVPQEAALGNEIGVQWMPNTLDPRTATRSHARTSYYDSIANRPNLHLLTGQTANEILLDGLVARGIRFTSRADNTASKAYASKEVILAGGAVLTPHLLQLSGIGAKKTLAAAGVAVKKDHPSVGTNFQDHPTLYMTYNLTNQLYPYSGLIEVNATYNASVWEEYQNNHTGPYSSARSNSVVVLPLVSFSPTHDDIVGNISSQDVSQFLPAAYEDARLRKGFEAQRDILIQHYARTNSGTGLFALQARGTATVALQKPLSRGTITLDPENPTGWPIVQYNTFMNPVDRQVLAEMVKFSREHWRSPELARYSPRELTPGVQDQADDEIIRGAIAGGAISPSLAHPSGSCAMMPEKLGGCVSFELLVYGTERLSVVDASIIPMIPAANLQATVYAVAEKAADIIKARA